MSTRAVPVAEPDVPTVDAALPRPRRVNTPQPALVSAPEAVVPSADCISGFAEHCVAGDMWLIDSCGRLEDKVEECGDYGCSDDDCVPPPVEPCSEPAEGRCDGDLVKLCVLGKPVQIDCAKKGLRCGQGDEGAECQERVPEALQCDPTAPPRCDRDTLVRCVDGKLKKDDCSTMRARCMQLSGAKAPGCVIVITPLVQSTGCGPCGCTVPTRSGEVCDGVDQDGDGFIDQGLDCGPVPIHAFVVTGGAGETSHAREDIEAEIDRANLAFQRVPPALGISLQLKDVTFLADESFLTLDDDDVQKLATDPRIHPASDQFYVPMVFTDQLMSGETPKPGLSTLPNGTCGGMQEGPSAEVGFLAVAKARYPTTVAHELGHFFGLCHTHDQQEALPFTAYTDGNGRTQGCYASCRGEGDGICDTPFDPGPDQCAYDNTCNTSCRVQALPDPLNLMSYYATCRTRFSDQQMSLMQHTLALRRGWNRCLNGACACTLGGLDCPAEMSCRPVLLDSGEQANRCGFDGPRGAGADCTSPNECGGGTVCMKQPLLNLQRCVRPCTASSAECTCSEANGAAQACLEDFGVSTR